MIRVISGVRRGQKLLVPSNVNIRPTSDRVKTFIFDYLGDFVVDARILDLFAGSGSLGIEALSRGAAKSVFVESIGKHCQIIKRNLEITNFINRAQIFKNDCRKYLNIAQKKELTFDLIFADPPYEFDIDSFIQKRLDKTDLLVNGGMFIFEHPSKLLLDDRLTTLSIIKQKSYGNTNITIYLKESD